MSVDYQQLAAAMLAQLAGGGGNGNARQSRYKAVSSTPTTTYGHGPAGLFSHPAMERPVFSAMILPATGLAAALPVKATSYTDPLFGIITGVTATTGDEADGVCDDPPTVGLTKLCKHSFPLGRFSRQTRVFDIDRMGKLTDRGEHTDFQLFGNPAAGMASDNPFIPTMPNNGLGQALNNEIAKIMFEFGVGWSRDFARVTYTGDPANNTASGGYKEFYGLDTLVNTGYRDAETGVACPAADSYIFNVGVQIGSSAANNNTIVNAVTSAYHNVEYLAKRANLMPATWGFAMTYGAFYELVQIWPIAYATYRVAGNVPTGSTNFVDSTTILQMRDEMLTGEFLLVDGRRIPVIIDDAITETETAAGVFESDIYLIPFTVLGGTPVTYWEYYDYTSSPAGSTLEAARMLAGGEFYYTSDNGRFLWHRKPPTNFCVQVLAKMEPRLLLLTPYLAARITNVQYAPLQHQRDPFTDGAYFVNGGGTDRSGYGPSYYSPTS